jgi:hypothetical protein
MNIERRHFLGWLSFGVGVQALPGCGGGGDAAAQANAVAPAPAPAPAAAPVSPAPGPAPSPPPQAAPAPSPAAPLTPTPTGARQFTLLAPTTGTHPFCLGFAFPEGEVPAGQVPRCEAPQSQVVVKSTWPDGSARMAVVAGLAEVQAGSARSLGFSLQQAAAPAAPLGTAQLRATAATAVVDCGSFGSAQWTGADWDSPFITWVAGPEMSSWVYRKPVGSDAHLVAWLEVRLFANGALEVLPWVENGYIRVAGPTSKAATYSFSLGGTQRFRAAIDLPHHSRSPLVSGAALSHWLGSDPGLQAVHDTQYLQATRLVPTYGAQTPLTAPAVVNQVANFQPLQQGSYPASLGGGGYHPSIGLLPEWDVLYLATGGAGVCWAALQRNAYSAGRWPIHYRDENTHRPLRFSQYPNLSLNASTRNDLLPAPTGTAPPHWAVSHHPSVGALAYLVTGRFFHLETLQFAATMNYLRGVDGGPYANRNFSDGIFRSDAGAYTVRGAGWALRTLAQAAAFTPDDDLPLRTELLASLQANIEFNHAKYVAQAHNPFGFVAPYGDAYGTPTDGKVTEAPWQQDFYTAAIGYMMALRPAVPTGVHTQLAEFFRWKAQSVVGRLGSTVASDWLYRDAAPYTLVVAFTDVPDWAGGTGPWPANWRAMYDATVGAVSDRADGALRGGNFPAASSYWGNLQPAIAYALQHGVPGASESYARMTQASNWPEIQESFNATPVWSVAPRT